MDIGSISNATAGLSAASASDAVGIAVLKKAMDSAASSASQLIEALPEPQKPSNPPHLGQSVDITV